MKIVECDSSYYEDWDHFVLRHPNGSIFQTTKWLAKYKKEIKLFICFVNEQIKGGFCTILTTKAGIKGYHIPPYTHIHGPVFDNYFGKEAATFFSYLDRISVSQVDFKLPLSTIDCAALNQFNFDSSSMITYQLSFNNIDEYLSHLNKNKLRELKKILKLCGSNELEVTEGVTLSELEELLTETGKRGNYNIQLDIVQKLFFEGDISMIKIIGFKTRKYGIISVIGLVVDSNYVYNIINASKRLNDKNLKTINLLTIYKGIEYAINNRKIFDFEGSMIPGVAKFYSLMGGAQVPFIRAQRSKSLRFVMMKSIKYFINGLKKR